MNAERELELYKEWLKRADAENAWQARMLGYVFPALFVLQVALHLFFNSGEPLCWTMVQAAAGVAGEVGP